MSEEILKFSSMDDLCHLFGLAGFNSNLDGKEKSVVMHNTGKGLLDVMEIDFSYDQADGWWGNTLTPVRLFSELDIEELLKGGANYNLFNSSEFEWGLSANKRQTVESSSMNNNTIHFTNLHRPGTREDLMQPLGDLDNTKIPKQERYIFKITSSHVA
ncbi:unnamed protein product [Sphenostylis stenocarpa]|uniref:Uncharacterized protein n=1 Tax=Sphenostylis stenocarpa TaxID=92480 RepID=A0AA86V783_9FABA|nr:unnamed protein product [Sphenostylis stenocarpa]